MRREIVSVEGGEDIVDPRLLVVKGSGSTYVAGGKINGWVRPRLMHVKLAHLAEDAAVDRRLREAFFGALPRTGSAMEFFKGVATAANVYNNFPAGRRLWKPLDVVAEVLEKQSSLSEDEFRASVIWPEKFDALEGREVKLETVGDWVAALEEMILVAVEYEAFMEKAFELWRIGKKSK